MRCLSLTELNSHFSIAQQVINQFEEVEKVIFVPINKESNKKGLLDNRYRYNMIKLVADKNQKFEVSDMDFKDEKSSFTIESLEEMQKQFPDKQIWYIVGTDNLKILYTWKRAEDLVSKYKILDNLRRSIFEISILECLVYISIIKRLTAKSQWLMAKLLC